jgi:bifunctional non-homologous end joining protein LigD
MLIRKNTKAFKAILHLVKECESKIDRQKLIRLYITKAGQSVKDRISIDAIERDADVFYEMGYQTVVSNLESSTHQLHVSDDLPGIYFFRSNLSKTWDESPFEFDEAIKKEFGSLPDLPALRKREKPGKLVNPAPKLNVTVLPGKSSKKPVKKVPKKSEKKKVEKEPRQPDFKMKHKLRFTDLDTVVLRHPQLTKEDVLNYYNEVAKHMVPHTKDRPCSVRVSRDGLRKSIALTPDLLVGSNFDEIPDWIKTARREDDKEKAILCNDREQLLFCVELGCVEFSTVSSKIKQPDTPDYIVILIDSPDFEVVKAVNVGLLAREILVGLQLPSFLKTDGKAGLHIYIPLDSKSGYEASSTVAEYVCKLICLKAPELATLEVSEGYTYGKVSLSYSLNEKEKTVAAPYSFVVGESATIATPLLWEELKDDFQLDDFTPQTVIKRLNDVGDPFENLFKKKVNADQVLERLEEHYAFLF